MAIIISIFKVAIPVLIVIFRNPDQPLSSSLVKVEGQSLKEYTLNEIDLVPEGIDYSSTHDAFFLSSISKSKIIRVDRITGEQRDFIAEREFGYSPGVGLVVDDQNGLLHALGGYYMYSDSLTSLYTFNINSGSLVSRFDVLDDGDHFLNDLAMDDTGNIYLTDTKDHSVYILEKNGKQLIRFFKSSEIEYPNGIAISSDHSKLYIASYSNGIRTLDIRTREILNTKDTTGLSQGIDGLEFYRSNLLAVQNGVKRNTYNLRRLFLDQDQENIIGLEIIDERNPMLDLPLTFCIVDNMAILIGNSNLQYYSQTDFSFQNSDSTKRTKLLVYDLLEASKN